MRISDAYYITAEVDDESLNFVGTWSGFSESSDKLMLLPTIDSALMFFGFISKKTLEKSKTKSAYWRLAVVKLWKARRYEDRNGVRKVSEKGRHLIKWQRL